MFSLCTVASDKTRHVCTVYTAMIFNTDTSRQVILIQLQAGDGENRSFVKITGRNGRDMAGYGEAEGIWVEAWQRGIPRMRAG